MDPENRQAENARKRRPRSPKNTDTLHFYRRQDTGLLVEAQGKLLFQADPDQTLTVRGHEASQWCEEEIAANASLPIPASSFRRKRIIRRKPEPEALLAWTPAFAGVTNVKGLLTHTIGVLRCRVDDRIRAVHREFASEDSSPPSWG